MDAPPNPLDTEQIERLSSLDDLTRRRLYQYVAARGLRVTRDEAATALGLDRSLVAYHLDKLVACGLLVPSFARPEGRGGPGAGRPTKHYERAEDEFAVTLPARDYWLAAELLARASEGDRSGAVRRALDQAAADLGRERITTRSQSGADGLLPELRRQGFEPYHDAGAIRLRNCPFHRLAQQHPELICAMNLALLNGIIDGLCADVEARLDPAPGRCCVTLDQR